MKPLESIALHCGLCKFPFSDIQHVIFLATKEFVVKRSAENGGDKYDSLCIFFTELLNELL